MTRLFRILLLPLAFAALEALAVLGGTVALSTPAAAQFIDDRFPFFDRRYQQRRWRDPWGSPRGDAPRERTEAVRPPAARKHEGATLNVVVLGDSMAEWLAYGLEEAFAETPEVGVLRKHKPNLGLIRTDRQDDWPQLAREILNAEKVDYVVMMVGIGDRQGVRERQMRETQTRPGQPAGQNPQGQQQATQQPQQPAPEGADQQPQVAAREPAGPGSNQVHEFRSEKWIEFYTRRLDDTMAALKAKGVPVLWVSLPAVRGQRSTSDLVFLNDLQRGRAEKARIIYVDNWDGFVDEGGAFTSHGPDVEGQIRRLRTSDGVNFTKAGAHKLAHYVEREIRRLMAARTTPVALPIEEPEIEAPAANAPGPGAPAGMAARPIAGPIVSLTGPVASDELLGGSGARSNADAVATRVLVKGEPLPAPPGRADDFSWPRREVATTTSVLPPDPPPEPPPTARPATPPAGGSASAQSPGGAPSAAPRPPGQPRTQQAQRPHQPYQQAPPQRSWPFFWPFGR